MTKRTFKSFSIIRRPRLNPLMCQMRRLRSREVKGQHHVVRLR